MTLRWVRWLLRPIERLSSRAAALCWLLVLTFAWLADHRRRARAWKTLEKK